MLSYICGFPDLDRGFSSRADPEEVDRARTRRLAAKLFRVVRPFLAIQPRRLNAYIALDALAWAAARIIAGTEGRNALDFFALALTQNLAGLENSEIATDATRCRPAVRLHRTDDLRAGGSFECPIDEGRVAFSLPGV
jgi:hypothetical protein